MFKNLYLRPRFFVALIFVVALFVGGFYIVALTRVAKVMLFALGVLTAIDILLLFRVRRGLFAARQTGERFSNGDDNPVYITVENFYRFDIDAEIIDEIPEQFQIRDQRHRLRLSPRDKRTVTYSLHPVARGVYTFGVTNVYVSSGIGLVSRRFRFGESRSVAVYPSFIQMRKYELLATSYQFADTGIKRVRRVGHTFEFDRIREYVQGDDYRTLNWKATARRSEFMVNEFQDERSQQVYSVIDMGRTMKMPFEGMALLDYAINASLVISNIAIRKHDKAGVITLSDKMGSLLAADRRHIQMQKILELLYKQTTQFLESNFELLFATIKQKIRQRSLLLLFSNFETLSSMKRQLPYLRRIARSHLLVTIFFENTELRTLLERPAQSTEEIYLKTTAEKFAFEKRQIVRELARYGIHALLTTPSRLSVNTINKYLELKARGLI